MANSSLEKFEAEAEAAKLKVKFAKAVLIMIDAFKRKDEFEFESFSGACVIFEDKLINRNRLTVTFKNVKHFEELHEIKFDKKPNNTKDLKSAMKLIESSVKSNLRLVDVVWEMVKEELD